MKKRNTYHETLEKNLHKLAPLFGCEYVKIPDVNKKYMKIIRESKRYDLRGKRRPFDGILITPKNNWCIEVKVRYDKLKDHQRDWQRKVNDVNNTFVVIRMKIKKKEVEYLIEHKGKTIMGTHKLENIIECLKHDGV